MVTSITTERKRVATRVLEIEIRELLLTECRVSVLQDENFWRCFIKTRINLILLNGTLENAYDGTFCFLLFTKVKNVLRKKFQEGWMATQSSSAFTTFYTKSMANAAPGEWPGTGQREREAWSEQSPEMVASRGKWSERHLQEKKLCGAINIRKLCSASGAIRN